MLCDESERAISNGLDELRDAIARELAVNVGTATDPCVLLPLPDIFPAEGNQTTNLYTAEQMRDYALDNGSRIAAMHVSILRRQLESLREVKEDAFEALTAISEIEDKVSGGDWDEIEQARDIANAALSAYKASVVVLPENQSPC